MPAKADSVFDETTKAMATTPINNRTKIAMSKAIPASLRRFRIGRDSLTLTLQTSLIRIDAAAASFQLYKTWPAGDRVWRGGGDNQGDGNVPNV